MTKTELNARLAAPLSASKLKKTSLADLQAMVDAQPASTTAPKTRKARELDDRVILAPGKLDDVRPTKAGSKRALLVEALAAGATVEEMMDSLGWNRETVTAALRTDIKAIGLGVERKAGRYHLLLPEGMNRPPLRDADASRADALSAACQ